ncbi:MAG: 3-dehydroquinate synthase [Bacteroidota bacterium]
MAEIKSTNYSVFISKNITKDINQFLKTNKNSFSKLFILVDENTLKHCYPQLVATIPAFENAEIIEIESGEESKNIEVCAQLWATLSELGADRQSLLVNLGGGVIGDMGGFIASTFKRGISFINIPTTLLSQVDASIGGKVGVDLNHLKNEIGLFSNPLAVFIDSAFLNTLDRRQLLSGFAEMIKHALIADADYWKKIKKADSINFEKFDSLIETSIRIKNKVVQEDPFEKNSRKLLNFGHTIGHAIETYFLEQQKSLLHGEAIAVGMICEAYLSNQILKLPNETLNDITGLISNTYTPVGLDKKDIPTLIELMSHDKKNEKGKLNFSLLSDIGTCEINQTVSTDLVKEALDYYLSR